MKLLLMIAVFFAFVVNSNADYSCKDWSFYCDKYMKLGWCDKSHRNNGYMKNMCPKICGFCGDKTTSVPTTSSQPTTVTTTRKATTQILRTTTSEPTQTPGACSLPNVASGKVIAGSEAKPGQFPWQVAMYVDGHFLCGGSIITPEWVVTAAHCLFDLQPTNKITVVAGDFDRSSSSGEEQVSELEMPHIHPHYYEPIEHNNDIALMKLKTPFKLGKYVQTVCIPQQNEIIPPGSKCFLSGWGRTQKGGKSAEKLQFTSLNIVNQTQCVKYNYRVSDRMLCGYDDNNIKASGCQGDSGGPLICQGRDNSWKLHGVVSWGSSSCDTRYKYTVFAEMSKFRYFINETMGLIKKPTLAPPPPGGCDADISSGAAFRYAFSSTPSTCGLSNPMSGRVIAGQKAKPGQFPWQVAIYKTTRNYKTDKIETKFQCGGSLISPRWVLTAAHCVYRSYARKFNITMGNVNRQKITLVTQQTAVERIITFPKYKRPVTLNNDVALLKLRDVIWLGNYKNTICLPKQGEKIAVGSKCFISGWGKTADKPFVVDDLQHASLRIMSNEECYRRQWRINEVTDQMVCASNGRGCPQSGCQGDSGGPLVCQRPDGRWVQHGIVSWGSPYCDTNEASTVFARVSEFRDWIEEMREKYN